MLNKRRFVIEQLFGLVGVMFTAILSLIGVIYQNSTKTKQDDLINKVESLKKENKEFSNDILNKLDEVTMNNLKRFIVLELTKINSGVYTPTDSQKRMLKDAKDEYNRSGGDSYVDDLYDELREKHII